MNELIKNNIKFDMILTDPPYGTTACKWDSIISLDNMWKRCDQLIKNNSAICLFGSEPFSSKLRCSNLNQYKYDWIWDKKNSGSGLLAKIQPLKIHEIISVFGNGKVNYYPQMTIGKTRNKKSYGSKKDSVTGYIDKGKDNINNLYYPKSIITDYSNANQKGKLHPTQKPVDLLEYLIRTYTNENDLVLDFTMGSGSTGVACMNTGRRFIGIEKEDKYCKIAQERIESELKY